MSNTYCVHVTFLIHSNTTNIEKLKCSTLLHNVLHYLLLKIENIVDNGWMTIKLFSEWMAHFIQFAKTRQGSK